MLRPIFLLLCLAVVPARAAETCRRCNVVLVSLDALQASHVGALGGRPGVTPRLDALASRGALFSRAYSGASWTVPATMSWFTGTYPSVHKVVNKFSQASGGAVKLSNLKELSPGLVTLAEVLKGEGYATAGFTGDAGVNGAFGFSAGFDVYVDSVPPFSGLAQSADKALAWLADHRDKPFFLFLHGYDAHGQAFPAGGLDRRFVAPGYTGRFTGTPAEQRDLREAGLEGKAPAVSPADVEFWRAVYDEKAQRADAELGRFLDGLEKLGLSSTTIVVAASDHGTELFEHGRVDHGFSLHEELLRVPLVIALPNRRAGRRVDAPVSTVALMPTILELTGARPSAPVKAQLREASLAPYLDGAGPPRDVYFETDYRLFTRQRGLRSADGWKLVYSAEVRSWDLYDLNRDPGEKRNLAAAEPARLAALRSKLESHLTGLGSSLDGAFAKGCLPVYNDQCR